jgi:hypothetical protein
VTSIVTNVLYNKYKEQKQQQQQMGCMDMDPKYTNLDIDILRRVYGYDINNPKHVNTNSNILPRVYGYDIGTPSINENVVKLKIDK